MRDPNIEDISCDGSGDPIFLYHRKYGSVKSNIEFNAKALKMKSESCLFNKCPNCDR